MSGMARTAALISLMCLIGDGLSTARAQNERGMKTSGENSGAAAAAKPLQAAPSESANAPEDYTLLVFLKPIAARQAEFDHWYQDEHMPEVVNRSGFVTGRRFGIVKGLSYLTSQEQPNPTLVMYEITTADLAATFANDALLSQAARLQDPPLDATATYSYTYEKTGPLVAGTGAKAGGAGNLRTYEMLVFDKASTGDDDTFQSWFNSPEFTGCVSTPGIVGLQRYRRSKVQRYSSKESPSYLAIYTIETADLKSVFSGLHGCNAGLFESGKSGSGRPVFVFEALGSRIERK
jgi:hypothetical protein